MRKGERAIKSSYKTGRKKTAKRNDVKSRGSREHRNPQKAEVV